MKMLVMCCVGWSDKTDVRCEVFYRTCFRFFEERTPNFSQPDTLNLLTPTRKSDRNTRKTQNTARDMRDACTKHNTTDNYTSE